MFWTQLVWCLSGGWVISPGCPPSPSMPSACVSVGLSLLSYHLLKAIPWCWFCLLFMDFSSQPTTGKLELSILALIGLIWFSLTSPILVDLVSIEQFSSAYGFLLACQGVGNLVGPPFAGWLYDYTKEWFLTFDLAGVFIGMFIDLVFLVQAACVHHTCWSCWCS